MIELDRRRFLQLASASAAASFLASLPSTACAEVGEVHSSPPVTELTMSTFNIYQKLEYAVMLTDSLIHKPLDSGNIVPGFGPKLAHVAPGIYAAHAGFWQPAFAMLNRVHEYVAQAKEPPTHEQLVEQLTKIGQKTIDEHRNKKGERLDVKVPLVVTGRYRHPEDVKISSATTLLLWETANDFTPRRTGVSICWASSPEISEIATAVMRLKELDYLLNNSPLAVAQALEAVHALVAKLTTFVSMETNIVVIGQGEEHALLKGQMLRLPNAALNFG